jgi:hypothetical protein
MGCGEGEKEVGARSLVCTLLTSKKRGSRLGGG